jgi:hypothetical protein
LLAVAGFQAVGVVEGHAVVALIDQALAAEAGEQAADGFAGESRHAAELFLVKLHVEGDGEVGECGGFAAAVCAGPIEEGAGEFAGRGGVESETARGEEGALILASDGQGGDEADVGVGFHDADEVGAGDGLDGAGGERLCADTVDGLVMQRGEAEDVARAGNAEQEQAAVAGGSGDFDATSADDQEVIGGQAFVKQDGVGLAMATNSDRIEIAYGLRGECAKSRDAENGTVLILAKKNGRPPGS